jgi:hypothetical protein
MPAAAPRGLLLRAAVRNDHRHSDAEQRKDQDDDRYDDERRGPTKASP